jgi:hypothetical protein
MTAFRPVALQHASRLVNHGPTARNFRDDNEALQSIHHLGAGLFVRAGGTVQAAQMKEIP